MPIKRDSQSRAIREALLRLGPQTPTSTVVRHLARWRIRVRPNLVNKTKSRLAAISFWDAATQRDLRRARAFVAQVGSMQAAKRALQILDSIE